MTISEQLASDLQVINERIAQTPEQEPGALAWMHRCKRFVEAAQQAVVVVRQDLPSQSTMDLLDLREVERLAAAAHAVDQKAARLLKEYLVLLPGYMPELVGQQPPWTTEHHGFVCMQMASTQRGAAEMLA